MVTLAEVESWRNSVVMTLTMSVCLAVLLSTKSGNEAGECGSYLWKLTKRTMMHWRTYARTHSWPRRHLINRAVTKSRSSCVVCWFVWQVCQPVRPPCTACRPAPLRVPTACLRRRTRQPPPPPLQPPRISWPTRSIIHRIRRRLRTWHITCPGQSSHILPRLVGLRRRRICCFTPKSHLIWSINPSTRLWTYERLCGADQRVPRIVAVLNWGVHHMAAWKASVPQLHWGHWRRRNLACSYGRTLIGSVAAELLISYMNHQCITWSPVLRIRFEL